MIKYHIWPLNSKLSHLFYACWNFFFFTLTIVLFLKFQIFFFWFIPSFFKFFLKSSHLLRIYFFFFLFLNFSFCFRFSFLFCFLFSGFFYLFLFYFFSFGLSLLTIRLFGHRNEIISAAPAVKCSKYRTDWQKDRLIKPPCGSCQLSFSNSTQCNQNQYVWNFHFYY